MRPGKIQLGQVLIVFILIVMASASIWAKRRRASNSPLQIQLPNRE